MSKLTLDQKKLEHLKKQLYGKEETQSKKTSTKMTSSPETVTSIPKGDVAFLKQDLIKILLFSAIAFSIQIILFIAIQNHYIKIY